MKYRDTYRIVNQVSRYVSHRDFRYRAIPTAEPRTTQKHAGDRTRTRPRRATAERETHLRVLLLVAGAVLRWRRLVGRQQLLQLLERLLVRGRRLLLDLCRLLRQHLLEALVVLEEERRVVDRHLRLVVDDDDACTTGDGQQTTRSQRTAQFVLPSQISEPMLFLKSNRVILRGRSESATFMKA